MAVDRRFRASFDLIHKGRIGGRDGGVDIASDLRRGLEGRAASAFTRVLVGVLVDFSVEEGHHETGGHDGGVGIATDGL